LEIRLLRALDGRFFDRLAQKPLYELKITLINAEQAELLCEYLSEDPPLRSLTLKYFQVSSRFVPRVQQILDVLSTGKNLQVQF
jgi:hypothetical protein